jgi:hypothetical protein
VTDESSLRTVAWLLMGLTGSAPGLLQLAAGRLSFTAQGRGALTTGQLRRLAELAGQPGLADELDAGRSAVVFDAPLDAVANVHFPWYYFGGGMKLIVAGRAYRFSFLQPQNTRLPTDADAILGAAGIPAGRASGKAWGTALSR